MGGVEMRLAILLCQFCKSIVRYSFRNLQPRAQNESVFTLGQRKLMLALTFWLADFSLICAGIRRWEKVVVPDQ